MESKKTKFLRFLVLIFSIVFIASACAACVYLIWEKAPGSDGSEIYTFFISGLDEQTYSTEINYIMKIDTLNHTIDVVPYPKDTLLNIDFQIRKLGSVYYGAVRNNIEPWKAVSVQLEKMLGFELNGYAFIPVSVFNDFLTDGKINDITTFFSVLNSATETNLSASNIAFLTRQSVSIDENAISYFDFPSKTMKIQGYPYEVIELDEWIEIINSHLNPGEITVTAENLDIVYACDEGVNATNELIGSWYYDNIDEELIEGGESYENTDSEY